MYVYDNWEHEKSLKFIFQSKIIDMDPFKLSNLLTVVLLYLQSIKEYLRNMGSKPQRKNHAYSEKIISLV